LYVFAFYYNAKNFNKLIKQYATFEFRRGLMTIAHETGEAIMAIYARGESECASQSRFKLCGGASAATSGRGY